MPQYVEVPATWLNQPEALSTWVEKSLRYVKSLPQKKKRKKKS
jgi:TfoX/Sxy family transcriptional regulator of competence genes